MRITTILVFCVLFFFTQTIIKAQCTSNAGPDKIICPAPGSVQIGSNPQPLTSYSWSPATGLSNPTISNPIASPSVTTTYTLTATQNLVLNGNFEQGNTGFQSDYAYYVPPTFTPGHYVIGSNPFIFNFADNNIVLNTWCNTGNHTPNGNNMMIVDGFWPFRPTSNNFWQQTVSVQSFKNYTLSVWLLPINPQLNNTGEEPIIEISINGIIVTTDYHLFTNNCNWINLTLPFNVGASTTAFIEMRTITAGQPSQVGNDFAVDDIEILECTGSDDVTVCVCSPAPPPYIVTVQIPIRHVINFTKQDPAYGRTCENESWTHGHWPLDNHCDDRFLMSGYMLYDNNQPSYNAFGVDFYMTPYNYSFTLSYLDFLGHDLRLYEPCFQNDIISAKLNLFHKQSNYCFKFNGWLNEYRYITQAHSGDNAFFVKRFTQNIINGCYSGSLYPLNNTQFTYDNLPAVANDILNIPTTTNPNQDYSINITSMLRNAVVPQSAYIGFLIKQNQTSTYNNILFNGISAFNHTVDPGEPYIELTYWRHPKAGYCDISRTPEYKNRIFEEENFFISDNLQIKDIKESNDIFESIKIYPNPAHTYINIKSEYPITLLEITNLSNQKVKEVKFANTKLISINISDLKAGVYNCTFTTKNGTKNKKLIIQR